MLPRGDGALADDEGDREDENGRGEAEADDEPGGALFGFVVAALRSVSLRRNAVDDERVRAGTTLQQIIDVETTRTRINAGDADEEVVIGVILIHAAILDGERVVAIAALRVREASTRSPGRARGREATVAAIPDGRGDADVEVVAVALDDNRVVAA